jgi:cephalosporin hydroxylase
MWVFNSRLQLYKPDRIVELGTGHGTLSMFFISYCLITDSKFKTVDRSDSHVKRIIEERVDHDDQFEFMKADIYDEETINKIAEFLNGGERPFILVDGKNPKSHEVNVYAPHLKEGTVIFAHDCAIEGSGSSKKKPHWCFEEDLIDWGQVERCEPYYSSGRDLDTRTLAMKKI